MGTRTFLFTDLVGSTAQWQSSGPDMVRLIGAHDRLVHGEIERGGGTVFAHTGDGAGAVFESARSACLTALRIFDVLDHHSWGPDVEPPIVRIGVHTGDATEIETNWFGSGVNTASRVCDAANGHQILVTRTTLGFAELSADDASLIGHGSRRLRGLEEPIDLVELVRPGDEGGPPPRVASADRTNLPAVYNPCRGREDVVAEVLDWLEQGVPQTLVGIGGVGKTRLGLEIGFRWLQRNDASSWLVDFTRFSEGMTPLAFVGTSLSGLGVRAATIDDLAAALRSSTDTLILLDNCEAVPGVADVVQGLVDRRVPVKVLATSREPLGIPGERIVPLRPLDVGDTGPAVQMFVDIASRRGLNIDAAEYETVREICTAVDGLPLAIELVAARAAAIALPDLMNVVRDSLPLLTGDDERHRTIAATIAWSYEQLGESAARVFRWTSLFSTWPLLAVTHQLSGRDDDASAQFEATEIMRDLVDRGLITRSGDRYRMLEPVRQVARRLLDEDEYKEARASFVSWVLEAFHLSADRWARTHPSQCRGPRAETRSFKTPMPRS